MQRQQEHEEEGELEGEDEELDELAMEECLHNREEVQQRSYRCARTQE